MKPSERYLGIAKAALEISYDNGGINRGRSEAKMKRELDRFLSRQPDPARLTEIDSFLAGLSDPDLQLVCAGEQTEAEEFLRAREAPMFLQQLLNDIFEKVG